MTDKYIKFSVLALGLVSSVAVLIYLEKTNTSSHSPATIEANIGALSQSSSPLVSAGAVVNEVKSSLAETTPLLPPYYLKVAARLNTQLDRIRRFDPSLTDKELFDYQNELVRGVESDPQFREVVKARLNQAFLEKDFSSVFELERDISTSLPGIKAVIEVYSSIIASKDPEIDYYALQGMTNFKDYIPQADRSKVVDQAVTQLSNYRDLANYAPAMRFLTITASDPTFNIPAEQIKSVRNIIEQRQRDAKGHDEQFFTTQALLTLAAPDTRAARAANLLTDSANTGTVDAVKESLERGETPTNQSLLNALNTFAQRQNTTANPKS